MAAVARSTVAFATDTDHKAYRIGNVALASLLGVAASWAIDLRVARLTRLKRTQSRVFESVPEGLAVLDNEGRVVLANPAMSTFAPGVAPSVALHRLLGHVLADGRVCSGGCVMDDPRRLSADEPARLHEDERLLGPDGERWIEYYASRVDEDTTLVSIRDVTTIIEAEQDRRALLEAAARRNRPRCSRHSAPRSRRRCREFLEWNSICGVPLPARTRQAGETSSTSARCRTGEYSSSWSTPWAPGSYLCGTRGKSCM